MNQLQAIPAAQVQTSKPPAKKAEATNQDFSEALKKLVSQKEEQTSGKQGTGKQEATKEETAKSEGATGEAAVSPKEPSTDEEIQNEQSSMELLQQLAASMMMQLTAPAETTATTETTELPVEALLPTEAVEQVQAELPKQAAPQPVEVPQTGSESLGEMELPKTGALFTVVQTDENGVPVEQQTAEAAKTPVVAETLQAESKNNTPQKAEAVPAEPEKAAAQTTQQPEAVQPQTKPETEAPKAERPQAEISVTQKTTTESKPVETQIQRPVQQETPVEGEKVQPQVVVEQSTEVKEPEQVEKIQVRTEISAESVQTTQQTVTVKTEPAVVSEPPKSVAVQLADKFATFEATSKTEFQMQLFPEDLGEVTVKMAVRDGVMVIDILSPNSKTQQILLANADDIKNMLQSQLQQRTQVVIPTEERPADFYHQQQEQSRHQQQEKDAQPDQNQQDSNIPLTGDFLAAFREIRMAAGLK